METHNIPFCIDELLGALSNFKDSAVGPDDIQYQMLKHLPLETLSTLLNITGNGLLETFLLAGINHMWCLYQNQEKTRQTLQITILLLLQAVFARSWNA